MIRSSPSVNLTILIHIVTPGVATYTGGRALDIQSDTFAIMYEITIIAVCLLQE